MQDACEQPFAIADRVGKSWSNLSRDALIEVCTGDKVDSQESLRLRLLRDIRDVFEERDRKARKTVQGIRTVDLLASLYLIEEAPWSSYYGRGLADRDLAALLKSYGIASRTIRFTNTRPQEGIQARRLP